MLLFDDPKKLEKALGEEAASVIAHVFEKADEKWKQELATIADLYAAKTELQGEMQKLRSEIIERTAETKHDILRWIVGGFIAQTALLMAVLAFLR